MNYAALIIVLLTTIACGKDTRTVTRTVTETPDTRMTCKVYDATGATSIPDTSAITPLAVIKVSELDNVTTNSSQVFRSFEGTGIENITEQFALDCSGQFTANVDGNYTLSLLSDDGSRLSVNSFEVITNDGLHGATTKNFSLFLLKNQTVTIRVRYFNAFGQKALRLTLKRPDISLTEVMKF